MASKRRMERLKRKLLLIIEEHVSLGISERSLVQELLDNGASCTEANLTVEIAVGEGYIQRETMGYLRVIKVN